MRYSIAVRRIAHCASSGRGWDLKRITISVGRNMLKSRSEDPGIDGDLEGGRDRDNQTVMDLNAQDVFRTECLIRN